jgi:hypothetical protein
MADEVLMTGGDIGNSASDSKCDEYPFESDTDTSDEMLDIK